MTGVPTFSFTGRNCAEWSGTKRFKPSKRSPLKLIQRGRKGNRRPQKYSCWRTDMPIANIAHKDSIGNLTEKSTDKQIRANKKIREDYGDLLDMYPDHPVVIVSGTHRVLRWKSNIIVNELFNMNM